MRVLNLGCGFRLHFQSGFARTFFSMLGFFIFFLCFAAGLYYKEAFLIIRHHRFFFSSASIYNTAQNFPPSPFVSIYLLVVFLPTSPTLLLTLVSSMPDMGSFTMADTFPHQPILESVGSVATDLARTSEQDEKRGFSNMPIDPPW